MAKENVENVGGSSNTNFKVGEEVFVGKSSTPAKIVQLLSNGYVEIEWPKSEGSEWESEYHVSNLRKLSNRRRRKQVDESEQQDAPTIKPKKKSKPSTMSSMKKSLSPPAVPTNGSEFDGGAYWPRIRNEHDVPAQADDEPIATAKPPPTTPSSTKESAPPPVSTSPSESEVVARWPRLYDDEPEVNSPEPIATAKLPEPIATAKPPPAMKPKPQIKKKDAVPDLWQVTGVDKAQGLKEIKKLLPKGLKKCQKEVVHFFLYCYERQMVWERRNLGEPKPYSESKAMQEYLFCNNYRELDRGTNYFRAQILELWDAHSDDIDQLEWIELVLFASVVYRFVNRVTTFETFGGIPQMDEMSRFKIFLKKQSKLKDVSLFTDAHQTGGLGKFLTYMVGNGENKFKQVSKLVLESSERNDLEGCFTAVRKLEGAGPFIAWQIVCDLMESQCLGSCTEEDWTELGPGAQKGINYIFGAGKSADYDNLELAITLRNIQDDVYKALGLEFPKWNGISLTLKNIEHPLCEFQKYLVIHPKMVRKQKVAGQRRIKTKAHLDFDKTCYYVEHCGEKDDILLCDKCLVGFCSGCSEVTNDDSQYWVCPRCVDFEAVSFE